MLSNQIKISILSRDNSEEIGKIRQAAYKMAYGSDVDSRLLKWGIGDINNTNFGVFYLGDLVSVFRIDIVSKKEEFELQIQTSAEKLNIELPIAVICRAATCLDQQRVGWNHLLRYELLQHAHAQGIKKIVSTCLGNSSWNPLFLNMGYDIINHPEDWKNFLTPHGDKQINILDLTINFKKAETALREYILTKFPLVGNAYFESE